EYGGLGLDYRYTIAAVETYGKISCGGIPSSIAAHTEMSTPALARFGSEYLKKEFLVPSIAGDVVACIGVSEPQAGSDVAAIKTTAKKSGDDLIINGQKMWITNGIQADWMCLLANTSQGSPYKNKSLICLPMKTPDTAEIFFEDVRIPAKNIIGEEGFGFLYQMLQFQQERIAVAALNISPLDRCIKETIAYTKERKIFGKPVLHNQYIHYRLAELQTEVEAFRALVYKCTGKFSLAECIEICASSSIAGGADEVMLSIICKLMGILPTEK
ncbi:putative acyl-CoA dehydrogenase 6, partial [Armadillidium vulgare]